MKWEYLTVKIKYDDRLKDWIGELMEKPPLVGVQAILDLCAEGWDLTSMQPEQLQSLARASTLKVAPVPVTYKATFKRPAQR